jgi:hypothetical protein
MADDLEQLKLQAEIEKLRAETASLKRLFSRPSDWIGVVIGIGGILTAVGQWQVAGLQKEKAALLAERRVFDAEKLQSQSEETNRILAEKVTRQQKALSEIDSKISEKSELLARISANLQEAGITEGTKGLVQRAQTLDKAIAEEIQNVRVSWKGKEFKRGDTIRITSWAGTFKPAETGHPIEIDASAGHVGIIIRGEKRQGESYFNSTPNEPIQIVRVRWLPQKWTQDTEGTEGEENTAKTVSLGEFEATIHVDYLEVITK